MTERRSITRLAVGVVAALAAFVLGWVGFHQFLPHPRVEAGEKWTDLLYDTLQLFLLDAAPLQTATDLPVTLEIARFLAPASTAVGIVTAVKAVYDSTYHAVRTRQLHDHTVICGSGTAAMLLSRQVVAEGRSCVVVGGEAGGGTDPSSHVLRVEGDPRDVEVLREARLAAAREVLVVGVDSIRTVDIAAAIRGTLGTGARTPVPCYLEMRSAELATVLAAHELSTAAGSRLEFFDPISRAVRRLLDVHLTATEGTVVLLGAGDLTEALARELDHRDRRPGRQLTVVRHAPHELAELPLPADLVLVVVAVDDDEEAIGLGLRVLQQVSRLAVEVVVATRASTSLGREIPSRAVAATQAGRARLHMFNIADQIYRLGVLRDGLFTRLARSAHESYVEQARARGETEHTNPSTASWEHLPADLRRENLAQAEAVGDYLRSLPAVVVPDDGSPDRFVFEGAEVERLAQAEHDRWTTSRSDAGWTYASTRDNAARHHPDLVDWDQLDATGREKDRDAIRAIPAHLRRIGVRIVRLAPGERS